MSGGSISEKIKEGSGRGAGKWESRYHKQIDTNNLLSERLRKLRTQAKKVVGELQGAYSLKVTELIKAEARIMELEKMLGEDDA